MSQSRNDIKHDIWVAAYLMALRKHSPLDAETLAINAARRYQSRWDVGHDGNIFDALSHHDWSQMPAGHEEEKEEKEEELAISTLCHPDEFAFEDASEELKHLNEDKTQSRT